MMFGRAIGYPLTQQCELQPKEVNKTMITRPTKVLRPFKRVEVPQSQEVKDASCEEDAKEDTNNTKRKVIICRPLSLGADDQGENTQLHKYTQDASRDGDSEMPRGEDPKVPSVGNPKVPAGDDLEMLSVGNPKVLTSRDDASSQKGGGDVIVPRKGPNPPVPDPNDTPLGPDANLNPP